VVVGAGIGGGRGISRVSRTVVGPTWTLGGDDERGAGLARQRDESSRRGSEAEE
jgi:hypothetical protein